MRPTLTTRGFRLTLLMLLLALGAPLAPGGHTAASGRATAAALQSGDVLDVRGQEAQGMARAPQDTSASGTSGPADELSVFLLTMGQGSQVYELYGHNAILVRNHTAGTDSVYNWGVFDMGEEGFITRFLRGRMLYLMAVNGLPETLDHYARLNRTVWTQELAVTQQEAHALRDFLRWNERPENARYLYDYFLDNCSTRARDALDRALGGIIRQQTDGRPTGTTYRSHSLRLMQRQLPLAVGVDIGLGRGTDHELTAWEEAFLPMELQRHIRDVRRDDGTPLVVAEQRVITAVRADEPQTGPRLVGLLLPVGLLLGMLVVAGTRARAGRVRGVATAVLITWSGVAGLLGTLLTLLWMVTDHTAAHRNENLLLFNPAWLLVAVGGWAALRGRATAALGRVALVGGLAVAALASVAVLLHLVGLSRQDNWALIALVAPVALATGWVLHRSWRRGSPGHPVSTATA
jgi:hypothetical protein